MPKLRINKYPLRTDGRTDPNYRKASLLTSHPNAEANYTIHTSPQESAKCGDKIKAYISCFHLQLNPSFPFFRDI